MKQPGLSLNETIATRRSLLNRLKDLEDQSSWQEFFDTYWRLIYSVGIKAGLTDSEAQEVVQETVISVAKKIEGFTYDPSVCSFKNWMLKLSRWRVANQLKKRRDQERRIQTLPDQTDQTPALERLPDPATLESAWGAEWTSSIYQAALERIKNRINPAHFQVFDLHVSAQWSVSEVTRVLGISAVRVYVTKHRIGRLIQKEVKKIEAGR